MRAGYISSIKPTYCRAFLRPTQLWDARATAGWWVYSRAADGTAGLFHTPGLSHTHGRTLWDQPPAAKQLLEVLQVSEPGQGGSWLCTALLQLGLGSSSWQRGPGAGCTWSQSHIATSVSNAFCCCARPADAVLVRNYATSVIHTCVTSWLCCSREAADSKKFPRTWEKPNGTDECTKTSSAARALGTQHPFSFFSVYLGSYDYETNSMDPCL